MDPNADEVVFDGFIRIYKSGRVERFFGTDITPASVDTLTGVSSKDVLVVPATGVSVRLYLPKLPIVKRLPLIIFFHGGGFCLFNAFYPKYHDLLNSIVSDANVIAVSVDYRNAPENPVPAQFDDAWAVLNWVASHTTGGSSLPASIAWLADHVDFGRVYVVGDSAGATIAHHVAMRAGIESLECGVHINGVALIHPYFLGSDPVESDLIDPERSMTFKSIWGLVCPLSSGLDDPWINPLAADAPSLAQLACKHVLVCVAENDVLRDRGRAFVEELRRSGWGGEVEMLESEGEVHGFYLTKSTCEAALALKHAICRFLNMD